MAEETTRLTFTPGMEGGAESPESKAAVYKQKFKLLKKAFIQEKEEKDNLQKRLVSSLNTIGMLKQDLDEKEQQYLRIYKENQELYTSLIEERSSGKTGHRGSVFVGHKDPPTLMGSDKGGYDEYTPKKKSNGSTLTSADDSQVSNLKISKLEGEISQLKADKDRLENEVMQKQNETTHLKAKIKEIKAENAKEVRELKYSLEILQSEREDNLKKVERKLAELESQKSEVIQQETEKMQKKIAEVESKFASKESELNNQISELEDESRKKTDDFLKLGVDTDNIKEELDTFKENEVKLNNKIEWLQQMNDIMQGILKKHEDENKMLAEKLVAFKQQILDTDHFNRGNKKYHGHRIGSFGRSPATLYFSEEASHEYSTELEYFLILTYGANSAYKVDVSKIEDIYIVQGTHQVCFTFPTKKMFKSKRSETFESEHAEEILLKYMEIMEKINEAAGETNGHANIDN